MELLELVIPSLNPVASFIYFTSKVVQSHPLGLQVCHYLVDHGADCNQRDLWGTFTPLVYSGRELLSLHAFTFF